MKTYFDTSFLVALYVPNDHTPAALRHRGRHEQLPALFTPLHRLELRTTVRQCAYAGLISEPDARRILRHIEEDLDDGTLVHEPLDWTDSLRTAEAIASRRGLKMPCRSRPVACGRGPGSQVRSLRDLRQRPVRTGQGRRPARRHASITRGQAGCRWFRFIHHFCVQKHANLRD